MSRLPILTYHSIDDDGSVISTNRNSFRLQMQFLRAKSFRTVLLSKVTALLHHRQCIPAGNVSLVFDDGFENVYSEAFPILQEFGFTATVFLVTRYCGKYNDWPGNLPNLKRCPLLSWNQAREMSAYGIEFGSHTSTHPDLTAISPKEAESQILDSKMEIEDRLGRPATVFAYPYGRYNAQVKDVVRGQFDGACSTRLGNIRMGADPYAMRRIDTWFLSDQKLFSRLTTTPLSCYLNVRQVLRDMKDLI
jgi:peptidoglycan/xylan/chitin deacetylase (PgdA/CDA1 family)